MKTQSIVGPHAHPAPADRAGFALVVCLSLMILLTVIAVGLLSLGAVSLRASSHGLHVATARANARMALALAIGELQKHTGPDTRVTARADVLSEENPPVTGVWKSWEGTNHEQSGSAAGRPVSPGNYRSKKEERFLTWLTSASAPNGSSLPDTGTGTGKVTLLGERSIGKGDGRDKLQIHLTPDRITGSGAGSFAWWVSGENQKARIPVPHEPAGDSAGHWAVHLKSHSVADPEPFGMGKLLDDPSPAEKAPTLGAADFIGGGSGLRPSREFRHDLSACSVGLLTNTATGGWRKDFSLLTENWSRVGTSNLPFFRLTPANNASAAIPTSVNPLAARSMIYPWSAYRGGAGFIPIYQHGAVASWEHLKDYILAYREKGMNIPVGGNARIASVSTPIDGEAFSFLHRVRVLPVIARVQWVFSHWAAGSGDNYEPRLLLTPVVTMWNPYNVEMTFSGVPLTFSLHKPLPVALKYTIGAAAAASFSCLTSGSTNYPSSLSSSGVLNYVISSPFTLKPGETRVFSPTATPAEASASLQLQQGYRSRGGHYFPLRTGAAAVLFPAATTMRAEARFDTAFSDGPAAGSASTGVGIYLDMSFGGARHLAYRMTYTPRVATEMYKPISGLASSPPLSSAASNPTPFMTTIFGARMASRTHIAAKGFVQSSPLVNYTAMGGKDMVEVTITRHYGGTNHPVNSPFDYSFEKVAPAGDSLLPNESDSTGRGYIVTGFTKADGLSRCVIAELPTRPVVSLMELQNWDIRYENPIPPFAFNIVGNSDASPLLPADAVVNKADAGLATNLQHDDSYCANHLLFDDWFFSSITRTPNGFGNGGSVQKTYADFVSGKAPLAIRGYRPLAEDYAEAAASSSATALFNKHANRNDSWRTIASRIEVSGMFNVNSTSVTAWRALLGHARGQKIPHIRESGAGWSVALSDESDHAMSRFSVAGDVESRQPGSSGAFPEAAEFAGYRVFGEEMLDSLAERIVGQVRRRGPFLSLAEFVNRQLSSGDLALAGAVQTALDELSESSSTDPYAGITSVIDKVASATPPAAADAEYRFPAAASGHSTYGLPGWTRQADVLRPLAPILSARDDTFTIRAYGDARDPSGNITASAVCEAVVRRVREFVDPRDAADSLNQPALGVNKTFGRGYRIESFRWVDPSEV